MSKHYQSGQRMLRAAGITLALLGLTGQSAFAQESAPKAAESLTVVKDAETGQLRAPTADEAAALQAQANAAKSRQRVAPQTIKMVTNAKGFTGYQMTDESLSMSVAVRKADGSIERQCFDSHGAGADAVAKGHVHTNQAVTE